MNLRDQIAEQALALPPEDRAFLADTLEQSLSHDGFATEEIAAAWSEEIERRIAAYDRGEVTVLPADVALDSIRKRLEEFRARKLTS